MDFYAKLGVLCRVGIKTKEEMDSIMSFCAVIE